MTIGEYRSKLQRDLQQAAIKEEYCQCRELVGMLELLDGLPPETPARFLTFSEIVSIEYATAKLAKELKKKGTLPDDEPFCVKCKFYALAEAYKLRGEKKSLAEIARLTRAALSTRRLHSGTTQDSALTIGEYRKKITKDLAKAAAKKNRWQAADLSALLKLISDIKDDAPANVLTFSDIMQIGPVAYDLAQDLYRKGDITFGSQWAVIFRCFALAEGFTLRGKPLPLDKLGATAQWRLQTEDLI
jgi:hypothetical protein